MKWVIIICFLFSSFLFFIAILQAIFLSEKRLERRMKQYLQIPDRKKIDAKKFNLLLQLQLTKQRIRTRVLTKEKSSKLDQMLQRSGLPLTPEEYILLQWISTAFGGAIFFLITGHLLYLIIGAFLGFMFPKWLVKRKEKERIQRFNEMLPDMLTTIIGSLRAGFSFNQSLQTVVEESASPIKEEIELVLKEMQYGVSIEDALYHLKERVPSTDLDLMIQAILIQRQVGGNLATVLEKIVETIRDRTKIQRQVSTLTAQGRLSGIVIGLLPIILGLVIYWIEPDYIGTLFNHPIGLLMLVSGIISGIVGFVLIRKITTIEV